MRIAVIIITLFHVFILNAQFSGTALTEYQYGKLPDEASDEFHSVYTNLKLNYQFKKIKAESGLQVFQSPYDERNYVQLSEFTLGYQTNKFDVNLGNYSEILGKGMLLRNYEIPGAVIENLSYRSKQFFYTDMLGAAASYKTKSYSIKAMWGYALNNLFPPTQDWNVRRSDEIFGAEFGYQLGKHKLEVSGLRLQNDLEKSNYGMLGLGGNIIPELTYYIGYANYLGGKGKEGLDINALYGNISLSLNKFGASLEFKNYENFLIGSGINEPPALVKEHTYKLLNRSTHVLQPSNEKGIQLETFYQPDVFSLITFNYTFAQNEFLKKFNYNEWFLEYNGVLFEESDFKLFTDYAIDEFKSQEDRITIGTYLDHSISDKSGFIFEAEAQNFNRFGEKVKNRLIGLTYRYKSKFYAGINTEWSNDTFVSEDEKYWVGGIVRYKASSKHSFQMFAGERRGGPACSAGVCYEVLDFKGVELRWTARL